MTGPVELAQSGTLNFNHTSGDYLFNNLITGNGAINVLSGTTILSGRSAAFTGTTEILSATLGVTGQLGGTVNVDAGGRLTGNGSVGATTVLNGGTLAPDGTGRLTVNGNLSMLAGSAFDFNLGHFSNGAASTTSASVFANGDVALHDVTFNISGTGEPAVGYYRMINYTGGSSISGLTIGTTPPISGLFPVTYSIDSSRLHVVDLIASPNGTDILQRWDDASSGTAGGSGTWNALNNNWFDLAVRCQYPVGIHLWRLQRPGRHGHDRWIAEILWAAIRRRSLQPCSRHWRTAANRAGRFGRYW